MSQLKKHDVEWTDTARADLQAIVEYIADDNPDAALLVLEKLGKSAEALATMPLRGRIVPELSLFGIHVYREVIHAPWRIVYRISGTIVHVLAVVDSRRNLEDLLLERFIR